MSTLNKTGLRLAAAGAAAALALAAGAPAFAQETEPENPENTENTETTPEGENTETTPEGGSETEAEETEAEETPAEDTDEEEVIEDGDDLEEEIEEDTEEEGDDESYFEFAYLDQVIQGADVGSTVTPDPQFQAWGTSSEDSVASLVWFTDAVDFDKWVDEETAYTDEEISDNSAKVQDEYDNCTKDGIWLVCIVDGWDHEDGKIYGPSEASPINYVIEDEVSEFGMSVYAGYDITQEELDMYVDYLGVDLENGSQFELVELDGDDAAPEDYFVGLEGWIFFEASLDDVPHPNVPGSEDPALPSTGNSSIVLISSAAAALLAGAVVFFFLRRRKTAANWE